MARILPPTNCGGSARRTRKGTNKGKKPIIIFASIERIKIIKKCSLWGLYYHSNIRELESVIIFF
jgi:hypothetical protein